MTGTKTFAQFAEGLRPAHRTVSEYVADALRRAIQDNVLPHGSTLRQEDLAASLKVSRMPVREALRLLEAEGLVEFSPHRGAVVAKLSTEELIAVFEIRCAIEMLAIKHSVPLLTDAEIAAAEAQLVAMTKSDDVHDWLRLHRQFHLGLCRHAHERIVALAADQYNAIDRYLLLERATMQNRDEDDVEHRQILDACADRDVNRVLEFLEPHIGQAGRDLADVLRAKHKASLA